MATILFFHNSQIESTRPKAVVQAVESDGTCTVQYVDTDLDPDGLALTYGIIYVPTVIVLSPDGDERSRHIGEIERSELLTLLSAVGER